MSEWHENLPPELQSAPFLKADDEGNFKALDQVIADLQGAAAHMGNSLRIPGPDASAEDVQAFRDKAAERIPGLMPVPDPDAEDYTDTLRKMGLPEAADKYKAPADCPIEGEQLGQLMAEAFEAGLTQKQFAALLDKQATALTAAQEQHTAQQEAERAALKGEWGAAYDQRMGEIEGLLKDAPESLREAVPNMSAETLRWFHDLADSTKESGQVARQGDGRDPVMTPVEARSEATELTSRLQGMRRSDNPTLYDSLVKKRVDLMRMAS